MKKRNILLVLLWIASCQFSTGAFAQGDSVTVATNRVVKWVANIQVANEIIEEQADKIHAATGAIKYLKGALTVADTTIIYIRNYNAKLQNDVKELEADVLKKDAKIRRLRPWATASKILLGGVLIGSGVYIVNEITP